MFNTRIRSSTLLASTLLYFVIGLLFIFDPMRSAYLLYYLLSYGFFVMAMFQGAGILFEKTKSKAAAKWIEVIGYSIFGLFTLYHPQELFSLLRYLVGFWSILNVVIRMINWYVYFHDRLIGTFRIALEAFILTVFSILIIVEPIRQARVVLILIGSYFILYGLATFQDFLNTLTKKKFAHKRKIALPVFMNILLPQRLVLYLNRKLQDNPLQKEFLISNPSNRKPDLEILIHLGTNGFDSVGHVDLVFDHLVISYGNHDPKSVILNGIVGDGVVFFAEKSSYLTMIVSQKKRSVVSFGILLNDQEKEQVRQQLFQLAARFRPWYSNLERHKRGIPFSGSLNGYASLLTKYVEPKFFKFTHGKFKTYFVMTTNCVLLADTIVGKSSIDLISMDGMMTPGTYYDFLNKEFQIAHSIVTSRTIYTQANILDLQSDSDLKETIKDMEDPRSFLEAYLFRS